MALVLNAEGVDGSGKSTTCKILAAKLGATLYYTPPKAYLARRNEIDTNASDQEHYHFYLEGIQIASRELEEIVVDQKVIIIDRYWPTTVAYHRAMGVNAKLSDFGPILMPDLTLYFEVRPDVQIERLKHRGMTAGDRRIITRMDRLKAEYEALLLLMPHLRIDTSNRSPEQIAADIVRQLPLDR